MITSSWGIVLAASKGEKFSIPVDIAFLNLVSKPVLSYSLSAFEHSPEIDGVILVAPKERLENVRAMAQMFGYNKVKKVIPAATQRAATIVSALDLLDDNASLVTVHDAARPCITPAQIAETVKAAKRYGSGVLACQLAGGVKAVKKGLEVEDILSGMTLWQAVSPQSFKLDLLRKALDKVHKKKVALAEESEALSLAGESVHLVPAASRPVTIEGPADLNLAEILLR